MKIVRDDFLSNDYVWFESMSGSHLVTKCLQKIAASLQQLRAVKRTIPSDLRERQSRSEITATSFAPDDSRVYVNLGGSIYRREIA